MRQMNMRELVETFFNQNELNFSVNLVFIHTHTYICHFTENEKFFDYVLLLVICEI